MYDLCVRVLGLMALAACGRFAFDAHADDGGGDVASADAAPDARACTWSAFSTPQALPAIVQSSGDDWFPTPSASSLFFYSYRTTSYAQIFEAPANPYGTPVVHAELDQGANDVKWPTLTDDGLVIIYGVYDGSTGFNLWQATRATPSGAFSSMTQLTISTGSYDFGGFLSGDGLRLVFVSERTGPALLYETTRPDRASAFAPPQPHDELAIQSSGGPNAGPTLSADGLDVYYSAAPTGQYDIYTAHRSAVDQPFGTEQPIPVLDSARDDTGLRLSSDGATMFFNYNTLVNGGANGDMYTSTRTCN